MRLAEQPGEGEEADSPGMKALFSVVKPMVSS